MVIHTDLAAYYFELYDRDIYHITMSPAVKVVEKRGSLYKKESVSENTPAAVATATSKADYDII